MDKTVVEDVADLMRQKIGLAVLCGEILTALSARNLLPELAADWQKEFDNLTRGTHVRDA
jgi:hypothetical protein